MNFLFAKLHTVQALLGCAVCYSLLCNLYTPAGYILLTFAFFLTFPPKRAVGITVIFFFLEFALINSAFVLGEDYFGNEKVFRTTKGVMRGITADTGELLVGKFKREEKVRLFSRRYYTPSGELKRFNVPIISSLLKKRIEHSQTLYYGSGAVIKTTEAHIFAVRSYIDDELSDKYAVTGLYHLLAMSGFHVLIFSTGVFLLFSFIPKKARVLPALIILPLLIALSGFTTTVIRAVIFCWCAFLAWFLDMKISFLHFIAFVAAWMLIIAPDNLFSISFLLSFWAVFGIGVLAKKGLHPLISAVMIGVAATVFTLPIQLYFFGVSNIMSVFTTVLITPVIWVQMVLGILSIFFTEWMLEPLILIEYLNTWLIDIMYKISLPFLYISKPPTLFLVVSTIAAFILTFTRVRYLAAAVVILPLLPIYPRDIIIFPELPPSQKGYILVYNNKSEIFFQGMHSSFVRRMLPAAAKLGIRSFDYGKIRIFDGKNLYIKIKDETNQTGIVCINSDDGCPYAYFTRSNLLKPPLRQETKNYIIYKNNPIDERIILLSETGEKVIRLDSR
ncbi:MAG: ComEC/Rec2 family competence protein [Deferribacteraceae bacterium]|nr:ComEC/Rec2 family competence protein [Deferribacteraceae bacterium]